MIKNLGKAIGILAKQEAKEAYAYEDLAAFNAPSECYPVVERGLARQARRARKHAEAVAGAPLRVIEKEAKKRGGVSIMCPDPRWGKMVGRMMGGWP